MHLSCYMLASLASALLAAQAQERVGTDPEPLRLYKEFLSSPPMVREMLYHIEYERKADGLESAGRDLSLQLRWQPDAFFLREIPRPAEGYEMTVGTKNDTIFSVMYGTNACFLTSDNVYRIWEGATDATNVLYNTTPLREMAELLLSRPMNLGMANLRPGSVVWRGNQFNATNATRIDNFVVAGEIVSMSNGLPTEIQYNLTTPPKNFNVKQRVLYSYPKGQNSSRFPFIPMVARQESFVRGAWREVMRMRLNALETSGEPLPPTLFDWRPYMASVQRVTYFRTNDSLYYSSPDSPVPISMGMSVPPNDTAQSGSRLGFVTTVLLSFVALAVAAVWRWRQA